MRTTIHLHPQPDDFSAGHGGPGKYHAGYATVDMESGDVEAVIFLDSAAKCDALIKAAVEAKRLLLGDTIPPALEQDLAAAEASPANPEVAKGVEAGACLQQGPGDRYRCTLDAGHHGRHEAHGTLPLHTWLDGDADFTLTEYEVPTGHLPQHKGGHPECTLCNQPGHHLHAASIPADGDR